MILNPRCTLDSSGELVKNANTHTTVQYVFYVTEFINSGTKALCLYLFLYC